MDFWGLMIKKDDMIISCVEGIRSIIINFSPSFFWRKRQMRKITPVGVGKDIYIKCTISKNPRFKCLKRKGDYVCKSWVYASYV